MHMSVSSTSDTGANFVFGYGGGVVSEQMRAFW